MKKTFDLGDGPVELEYADKMRDLARLIDQFFNGPKGNPARTGFVLMVFPFAGPTDSHRCNYMSNAHRDDIIKLLEEQVAYFKAERKT